jgi:hypothetical protein
MKHPTTKTFAKNNRNKNMRLANPYTNSVCGANGGV